MNRSEKLRTNKISVIVAIFLLLAISLLVMFTLTENVSAHAPTAMYLTYKEETLTVYIDHPSDDPDSHYIETVTVTVNRVEVLSETYTSQTVDDKGKGMVTYSYTVTAAERDVISVIAECSIDGSIMETITIGEGDTKDDPTKDDPTKDDPTKDDPTRDDPNEDTNPDQKGESDPEDENITLLLAAIAGMLIVIIVLLAMLLRKQKGTTKKDKIKDDSWTTCPKCGSSIKMEKLPSHFDKVHPNLSTKAKERMIERVREQAEFSKLERH
jgi:Ca2+/Na+ antiporter